MPSAGVCVGYGWALLPRGLLLGLPLPLPPSCPGITDQGSPSHESQWRKEGEVGASLLAGTEPPLSEASAIDQASPLLIAQRVLLPEPPSSFPPSSPLSGLAPRGRGQELAFLSPWHSEALPWEGLEDAHPLTRALTQHFCPRGLPAWQSRLTAQ